MIDFAIFGRRWTHERVRNLNDVRVTVEALSRLGTGVIPGEELANEPPGLATAIGRITGRSQPSSGLWQYTCQLLLAIDPTESGFPLDGQSYRDDQYFLGDFSDSNYTAYERSNNGSVPVDGSAIVELRLAPGPTWIFDWDATVIFAKLTDEGSISQAGDTTPGEFELGSGIPGAYAWQEQYPTINGGLATLPVGRSGTITRNFARDLNAATGATRKFVRLWRAYGSGYAQVATEIVQNGDGVSQYTQQSIKIVNAAAGTFMLTFYDPFSVPTVLGPIPFNVQVRGSGGVPGLSDYFASLGFNVSVGGSGTVDDPFIVTFADPNFSAFPLMDADSSGLQCDQEWTFQLSGVRSGGNTILVSDGGVPVPVTEIDFPSATITFPSSGVALYTPQSEEHDINRWKQSGTWYTVNNATGLTPFSYNGGTWYAIPVIVTGTRTITGLAFWPTDNGGTGALAEMAIYNVASDGAILPNTTVATATAMDYSTGNALISKTISTGVVPGLYWLFLAFNTSFGGFGADGIVSVLPVDVGGLSPFQGKWLSKTGTYPSGFPANPFAITNAQPDKGPALMWKF